MPTYEYICRACGHEFEEFQSIKADPIAVCPKCRKRKVDRKIGTGGAVIFKGGGFYETDYRSESYRSGADAERKAGEARPDAAGTSKPETKADSKAAESKAAESKAADSKAAESKAAESKAADPKPAPRPEPKPDAGAAAAENKRIEARATHQSRIGRGVGNIVKKNAAPKKKR